MAFNLELSGAKQLAAAIPDSYLRSLCSIIFTARMPADSLSYSAALSESSRLEVGFPKADL